MPTAVPVPVRQHILRLREQGHTVTAIAQQVGRPRRTVQRVLHQAAAGGSDSLAPRYDHAPHRTCPLADPLRQEVLDLARHHAQWGAPYMRLLLHERHPDVPWPSVRTLQRWIAAVRPAPVPPGRKPTTTRPRATQPHEVWQIDAVEQLPLASGQAVCWLRVTDECSGAFLWTKAFPPGVLPAGARGGRAAGAARLLCRLGLAAGHPRRQRQPLGRPE